MGYLPKHLHQEWHQLLLRELLLQEEAGVLLQQTVFHRHLDHGEVLPLQVGVPHLQHLLGEVMHQVDSPQLHLVEEVMLLVLNLKLLEVGMHQVDRPQPRPVEVVMLPVLNLQLLEGVMHQALSPRLPQVEGAMHLAVSLLQQLLLEGGTHPVVRRRLHPVVEVMHQVVSLLQQAEVIRQVVSLLQAEVAPGLHLLHLHLQVGLQVHHHPVLQVTVGHLEVHGHHNLPLVAHLDLAMHRRVATLQSLGQHQAYKTSTSPLVEQVTNQQLRRNLNHQLQAMGFPYWAQTLDPPLLVKVK